MRADAQIPAGTYTEDVPWRPAPFAGTARVPRVLEEFAGGATIVLQGLHLNRAATARYCRELEAWLGHPVQANAYLTPRRSQGFPVHHDTHDVFVLQVSGAKRWLVYEPVLELPLKRQRYSPATRAPGRPSLELTLRAGDTLYLPRGWLHEALTSDADSLHLTIGINVRTWADALHAELDRWAEDDVDARRALPSDAEGAAELAEAFAAHVAAGDVAAAARDRFVSTRRPILAGQLAEVRALDGLSPTSLVTRRPSVIADFDGRVLAFEGKRLTFPRHAETEVAALVTSAAAVRLADLPGRLDDAGRLVLARRLVREGFLRVVG